MAGHSTNNSSAKRASARPVFPFTAIVGQGEMKLALLLNVVAPSVGGVLLTGHRGTAKSTAVRSLADLLPPLKAVRGCFYNCDPANPDDMCEACAGHHSAGSGIKSERKAVPVVELPLGATEDRVCGTIDLGRALRDGIKSFEPGLLARANRGFLYIDEVNLLEDHLVDLLLDVAATGRNRVEREGVSAEHPARFVLVGSGNPEEGELRPQLVDRFGLCVEVETERDLENRVRIVEHRESFDEEPASFKAACEGEQARLRRRVLRAAGRFVGVKVPRPLLRQIAELCLRLGVDGHRGEITVARAARAFAALEGRDTVSAADVRRVAPLALRHRLRRDPLEQGGGGARVERAAEEIFPGDGEEPEPKADGGRARNTSGSTAHETHGGEDSSRADRFEGTVAGRDAGRDVSSTDGRGRHGADERELVIPPAEAGLKADALGQKQPEAVRHVRQAAAPSRRRGGVRGSKLSARGRYAGASPSRGGRGSVAVDATLRATAGLAPSPDPNISQVKIRVTSETLRFKRYRSRAGTLFIFLVDTSGSMAANRIAQAKGALAQLLRRAYVDRDRVALVAFRGRGAELLLAPCASASRARALLEALPVGGATPLAAGLLRALKVARRAAAGGSRRVRLVLFTDGRANVPLSAESLPEGAARSERIGREIQALGASLGKAGVASLVVDTQSRFTAGGEGQLLARALGGTYVRLPPTLAGDALNEALAAPGTDSLSR